MRTIIALTIAALALAAPTAASAAATKAKAPKAKTTTISVIAVDFKFKLSKQSAAAGRISFHVVNHGKTAHDFSIDKKKTPLLKPGKSATLTVTLKKGRYRYLCTVPGHAELGMKGVFIVK